MEEDRIEQMIWERINATVDDLNANRVRAEEVESENISENEPADGPNFILVQSEEVAQESEEPVAEAVIEELDETQLVADPRDDKDITEKIKTASEDELHDLKRWLFGENIRLRGERLELKEQRAKLEEERRTQEADQRMYLNHIAQERKQIHKEEEMVAEKLEIIKRGFAELDADRRALKEREQQLSAREALVDTKLKYAYTADNPEVADALFLGVTSYLTLKKRYKDLMKMYHPDSMGGSTDMVFAINRTYDKLLKQYGREREIL